MPPKSKLAKSVAAAAAIEDAKTGAFNAFLTTANKETPGSVMRLSDPGLRGIEAISTGAISLDAALGVGGVPRGRIVELFGLQMSGKTSLALSIAANAQRMGGYVGFVDAEQALSRDHAEDMGVDLDKVALFQPSSGEEGLAMCERMVRSGGFDVIIVDSVAALVPQAEIDAEYDESGGMALHARLMSKAMRKLTGYVSEHNVCLIFINQVRTNLGAYGAPDTTTGGKALPFYASVRIKVSGGSAKASKLEKDGVIYGQRCKADVVKNKVAPPFRSAEYELHFGKGIQAEAALIEVCEQLGLITRPPKSSSYTIQLTGEKHVGKQKLQAALENDKGLVEALTLAAYAQMRGEGEDYDPALLSGDEDHNGYESLEDDMADLDEAA